MSPGKQFVLPLHIDQGQPVYFSTTIQFRVITPLTRRVVQEIFLNRVIMALTWKLKSFSNSASLLHVGH